MVRKIFIALLLVLLTSLPALAADDAAVYLAFVFYTDKGVNRTIIVGGSSMGECQEVFKAFLAGVDGGQVQDFSVAACRVYSLSNPPQS